jgi:hypothetical protein
MQRWKTLAASIMMMQRWFQGVRRGQGRSCGKPKQAKGNASQKETELVRYLKISEEIVHRGRRELAVGGRRLWLRRTNMEGMKSATAPLTQFEYRRWGGSAGVYPKNNTVLLRRCTDHSFTLDPYRDLHLPLTPYLLHRKAHHLLSESSPCLLSFLIVHLF